MKMLCANVNGEACPKQIEFLECLSHSAAILECQKGVPDQNADLGVINRKQIVRYRTQFETSAIIRSVGKKAENQARRGEEPRRDGRINEDIRNDHQRFETNCP